ncbi:hypothetical protein DICPUDRAFT_153601 [Dictyostelium purpureum]|uniref:RUN domain-containing protein n=1 Tax=Dictyostelium purpureum TaxID=5786 RepID=F0ZPA8_DICPU|nr:uncharacterized protein DICPUDRAFT_153601 [Dictyostelium purpureum]EGC34200.1 hypothetical protein DICPUDRAFT_153601 [Dictyostelium purpureum]|eukprot:XP_003289252.1 hypothetical protein DICPUDRAFT_153601 [Dictyostelium purpureum]
MFSSKSSEFSILTDLNGYIQQLLDITKSENDGVKEEEQTMIQDRNPSLLRICYCVEKILSNELKDVNFLSSTTMWDFLQNLPQCLPDTGRNVELAKDCTKTSIGRGRVLIRLALNDGLLEEYISSLCFSEDVLKSYYKENALLRNSEFLMMFQSLIAMLSHIQFSLAVKDKDLDKANYWEDIALTLLTNVETRVVRRFIMVPQDQQGNGQQQSDNQPVEQQAVVEEPAQVQVKITQPELVEQPIQPPVKNEVNPEPPIQSNIEDGKGLVSSHSTSSLNLDELENVLSEITSDEIPSPEPVVQLSNQIIPSLPDYEKVIITEKDYQQWDQLIENLIKSKKTLLLDYGAKGSAITVSDSCLEPFWLSVDRILTNELRKPNTSLYSNLWDTIVGIASVIEVSNSANNTRVGYVDNPLESNEPIEKIYQDNSFKRIRAFYFRAVMSLQNISNYLKQYFLFSKDNDSQGILIRFYKNNSIVLQFDYMTKFFNLLEDLTTIVTFRLRWEKDVEQLQLPKKIVTKVIKKKVIKKTIVTVKKPQPQQDQVKDEVIQEIEDKDEPLVQDKLTSSIDSNILDIESLSNDLAAIEQELKEEQKSPKEEEVLLEQQVEASQNLPQNLPPPEQAEQEFKKVEEDSIKSVPIEEVLSEEPVKAENQSPPQVNIIETIENNNNEASKRNLNLTSSRDSVASVESNKEEQLQTQLKTVSSSSSLSNSISSNEEEPPKTVERRSTLSEVMKKYSSSSSPSSSSSSIHSSEEHNNYSNNNNSNNNNNNEDDNKKVKNDEDKDNVNSEQFQNLLSSLKTSQESIEFRFKSDPTYSSYTDSYNNDPFSTSYMGNSSFTNENDALKSSSLSSSLIDYQLISEYETKDKKKVKNRNLLTGEDGQIFINTLYRTTAVKAAYYSQGVCPGCHIQLEKLSYFKTRICYYTGKYYCNNCHSNQKSLIPARILWKWEFKLFPVSDAAKSYITRNLEKPFDIFQFNPQCLNLNPKLQKIFSMREKLFFIGEYIESCRNKATLEVPELADYFVCDNVYTYSIMDLEKIYTTNILESTIQQVMTKYIDHVTKECTICKGKGFICEYCNDDNELIFSWMSLDVQNFIKCDKCLTLSHKNVHQNQMTLAPNV